MQQRTVRIRQDHPTEVVVTPENAHTLGPEDFAPGTRVILAAGEYEVPLRYNNLQGTPDNPIVITAEPGTILDAHRDQFVCLSLSNCRWVALVGLEARNAGEACLALHGCSHCLVMDCQISGGRRSGLQLRGYGKPLPTLPEDCWQWYHEIPVAAGNWIVGNVFTDCSVDVNTDWVVESEFVDNQMEEVQLRNSFLNRFRGEPPPWLVEKENCLHNLINPDDLPWKEEMAWPELPLERINPPRVDDVAGRRLFGAKVGRELPQVCDFWFECDDASFQEIVNNNFWLLLQHQDERGAAMLWPPPETYAELCYYDPIDESQHRVHGRDSMEWAQTMIFCGAIDPGKAAIEFNIACGISNVAWGYGEDYGSAVGRGQIDVVTHLVRAVDAHWRYTGSPELVEKAYEGMARCIRETEIYFESGVGLYIPPAGEQTAVDARAAFLFENCSLLDACRRMTKLADHQGDTGGQAWFAARAETLRAGIEGHLRDERTYLLGALIEGDQVLPFDPSVVGWQMLPFRYYPDADPEALEATYEALSQDRVPWGGYYPVLTRWVDQHGSMLTMTKDIGSVMGYEARTGRFDSLAAHLEWLKSMSVKPGTCLPDHYSYYRSTIVAGIPWTGYLQDPNADQTLGCNNCEQVAEWFLDLLYNMLGIRPTRSELVIQPALPWSLGEYAIRGIPLPVNLGGGQIAYHLQRDEQLVRLEVDLPEETAATILLPVPRGAKVKRASHELQREPGIEVEWMKTSVEGPAVIEVEYG